MRPRDWMRLFVPGICVGMLPACFSPTTKLPPGQAFTGQPGPVFGRLPNYGYGQPGTGYSSQPSPTHPLTTAQTRTLPALPEQKYATAFPAPTFWTGPSWTPYSVIQYGSNNPVTSGPIGGLKKNPLPTRPESLPQTASEESSEPPHDQFLKMATINSPGEFVTVVPPLTIPGSPAKDETAPAKLPPAITEEPPLLHALRCYIEKRPEDFREALKSLDAAQRDLLQALIPLVVRVSDSGLAKADSREVAVVVDQLQSLLWMLRPRAALVMDKFCFCKQVTKFGKFEALGSKPTFRPGDMLEIYAEIRNVSSQPRRSEQGDFRAHLRSRLEIRAPAGEVVRAVMCGKPDETLTPQHDYYQHYRFQLPDTPPGVYTLNLEATDVPTGRKVRQTLEFQVIGQ